MTSIDFRLLVPLAFSPLNYSIILSLLLQKRKNAIRPDLDSKSLSSQHPNNTNTNTSRLNFQLFFCLISKKFA